VGARVGYSSLVLAGLRLLESGIHGLSIDSA
jgi:hypothetical protein